MNIWLGRLKRDQGGQVLPMVCVVMIGMLSMAALAIDVGHAVYTSRELQATSDADALAAAQAMTRVGNTMTTVNGTGTATGGGGVVLTFSAATGGNNARPALTTVSVASTMKCLASLQAQGIPCVGSIPYNAIQVVQTSVMKTFFGGILGVKTLNLTSQSTAAIRGGAPKPSNIAIIMDTTLSMNQTDTDCVVNGVALTQELCATNGLQVLLQNLSPCGNYQANCATAGVVQNAFDQVALFTFPAVSTPTAYIDTQCTTPIPSNWPNTENIAGIGLVTLPWDGANPWAGIPTATAYPLPTAGASSYVVSGGTYQLTGYLADYRLSNAATSLNQSSALVKASGGTSSCGSMVPSNYDGVYGTYYAGVIYAAQSSLTAQQVLYPNAENVIILLSDGDSTAGGQSPEGTPVNGTYPYGASNGTYNVFPSPATSNGSYPSWYGQCGQAITAAKAASAAGTIVYTVGYGSPPTGCWSDYSSGAYPGISPCDAMAGMATAPQNFYSDWKQSGSGSTCVSSQPVTSLSAIFAAISQDLSEARLIPNNTN